LTGKPVPLLLLPLLSVLAFRRDLVPGSRILSEAKFLLDTGKIFDDNVQ
jgi:hypothetical protein